MRDVALVAFDGAQSLDIVGPLEVFSTANYLLDLDGEPPAYATNLLARRKGPVTTSAGLRLLADEGFADVAQADTVFVAGGDTRSAVRDPKLMKFLGAVSARRLASVCTGAFVLGEAGLLDGRRATTHWAATNALARRYPQVEVVADAIFIRSGSVSTSAGVCAGIDLALSMVAEDLGRQRALDVARYLVVFMKRPGGQSQFSAHLEAQWSENSTLGALLQWIVDNPATDLSVKVLAARAAMSSRNFCRVFARDVGITPAKFVERVRLDAARRLLEESSLDLETLGRRCGFSSAEQLRRSFVRRLGVTPSDYRKRFSGTERWFGEESPLD